MSKTSLSRRAMLGRIPAVGLTAIVPAAAIACDVSSDLDAELIALTRDYAAGWQNLERACDFRSAAEKSGDKNKLEAAKANEANANYHLVELEERATSIPAKTVRGLWAKAQILSICNESYLPELEESLIDDIMTVLAVYAVEI